ncbi:MAG: FHA domain-containing protein [Chloroflexota bacterium]
MQRKILFILALVLLGLWWPGFTLAQTDGGSGVVVDAIETVETRDHVLLRIFYTLTGAGLEETAVSQATIQLEDGSTFPARLKTPPTYVALVLDASGSMKPVFADVQQAAIDLVNAAPPEVQFAVLEFDDAINLLQPYTNNHDQIISAINGITSEDNGTCLYDVAYTAAQSLAQIAQNTPNRALVVFTDGRDEVQRGGSQTCSRITAADLSAFAAAGPQKIPIYTVGLGAREADVNRSVLSLLSTATGGLFVNGSEENFSSQLQNVLADFSRHGLAEAELQPGAGVQRGSLLLTLQDGSLPAPGSILFNSSADYRQTKTSVEQSIHISNFRYEALSNSFQFDTTLTNLDNAATLVTEALDQENNTQVDRVLTIDPAVLQPVRLSAANMTAGNQYAATVTARDASGKLLLNADGSPLSDTYEFRYDPPQPFGLEIDSILIDDEPARFNFQSLALEDDEAKLVVEYHTVGQGKAAALNGRLLNQATNQRTELFTFEPVAPGVAQAVVRPENGSYVLVVNALDETGNILTSASHSFTYVTPDNAVIRSGKAVQTNPLLLFFFIFLLAFIGYFGWRFGHKLGHTSAYKRLPVGLSLSAIKPEEEVVEEAPLQAALFLVSSPDASLAEINRWEINHFPFTIGRTDCDISISNDRHVSRKHAQIIFENHDYFIEDLGSSNGTFVNDTQITAREPMPLRSDKSTRLQIGKTTSFIFKIEAEGEAEITAPDNP